MTKIILAAILISLSVAGFSEAGWLEEARKAAETSLEPLVADIGAALGGGLDERASSISFPGGEVSARITAAGISGKNELIDLDFLPIPWITGAVGLPKGINLFVRGMSIEVRDAGESVNLLGGGVTYRLIRDRLVSPLPGVSLIAAHNTLSASGIKVNTTSVGVLLSKKILILTPRAGVFYDITRSEIKTDLATFKPEANNVRLTAGVEFSPIPFIFAGAGASLTDGNIGWDASLGARIALP